MVVAAATDGVSILPGNGNGTFGAARPVDSDFGAFGPFLQSSDSVSILPGNNGVFGAPTTFALEDQSIPVNDDTSRFRNTVFSLNTSDLDRDRFPDLIVSQGALLLTRPPAANRPRSPTPDPMSRP